ncbi:hypothetical protein EU527_01870 [Candidatus Thorarchaeota archaeon]|nr:MAG: hypothetical protein EU527_01870 [Candidatus Thorarchaeota archaeon]
MRNLLAGVLGSIIGAITIVVLLGLSEVEYPAPYDIVWFILEGNNALQSTFQGLLTTSYIPAYIITWVIVGIIITPFSKRGWNTVRSALWVGIIQGIFTLLSIVLVSPEFWDSPTRNISLIYKFALSVIVSLSSLISAYPLSILIERVRRQKEPPIPNKIETRCICGAVFKSNPLICSECGTILRYSED